MKKMLWAIALLALAGAAVAGAQDEKKSRGFMGVNLNVVKGQDNAQEIYVSSVHQESGADKAGVQIKDRIISINGVDILDFKELERALAEAMPGDEIDLQIFRDGETLDLDLILGEMPQIARYGVGKRWGAILDENRPFMGLNMQNLNEQMAGFFGVKEGVLVTEVTEDGPAAGAGLRAGDVILAWNGEDVGGPAAIREQLRNARPDEEVALTIQRKDDRLQIPITLGSRKGMGNVSLENMFKEMGNIQVDIPTIRLEALKDLEKLESLNLPPEQLEKLRERLKDMDVKIEMKESFELDLKDEKNNKKKDGLH